jgi:hypothetical protein
MDETFCGCEKTEIKESNKNSVEENKDLKDVSTAIPTSQPQTNNENSRFHRVVSAGDMILFQAQEEGPLKGHVSRGVQTKDNLSKAIFFVFPESNPEDEYRNKVDYANPVLLRVKTVSKLPTLITALSKVPPTINFPYTKQSGGCSVLPKFNFALCKEDIFFSPFER